MKLRFIILAVVTAIILAITVINTVNKTVVWTEDIFNKSYAHLNIADYEKQHKATHISNHIGLSQEDLVARLQSDKRLKSASTYPDDETAQFVLTTILSTNSVKIVRWLNHTDSPLKKSFHARFAKPIGFGIKRSNMEKIIPFKKAVVVLVKSKSNNYSILTSYPE